MSLNNIDTKQVRDYKEVMKNDPKEAKFTAKSKGTGFLRRVAPSSVPR